jgi:hypothetical protein
LTSFNKGMHSLPTTAILIVLTTDVGQHELH